MRTEVPRPPRTARQVTLSAVFLFLCVTVYVLGLLFAMNGGVDPLGPVILLGVLLAVPVTLMPFVARGRAPWVIPLSGLVALVLGWGIVLGIWHLGTLGA